jgi:hypothetical protein
MLGTDDEDLYFTCHEAVVEIEQLRDELRKYQEFEARLKAKAVEEEAWNDDGE